MPSISGTPVSPRHPPWSAVDPNVSAFEFRGFPTPLSWWQARRIQPQPTPAQISPPVYTVAPQYSRGAGAYTPAFGVVPVNPIGAGQSSLYRHPTISGPGARYVAGSIWWTPQTIATSVKLSRVIATDTPTRVAMAQAGIRDVVGGYRVG